LGGSDAHLSRSVGDAYTVVEVESLDVDGILEAVRLGRVRYQGS